jgi:hypothetical protein
VGSIVPVGVWLCVLLVGTCVLVTPCPPRALSDRASVSSSVRTVGWSGHRLGGPRDGSLGHHRSRHQGSAARPPVTATAIVSGVADIGVAQTTATAAPARAVASVRVMAPKLISGLRARWTSLSRQLARAGRLGTMLAVADTARRTRTSTAATDDIVVAVLDLVVKGPSVSPGHALTPAYQRGRGRLFVTSTSRPD